MSFFGGGTDMENFFRENGGAVLSTTFDKYCYVNVRHLPRFFDYSTELSYSKTERVTDIDMIQHPAIRNAMKMLDMHEIRLTYEADLPARSGLGTSSSFAVGMLNAFYALKGKYADKKKLADEAIYLPNLVTNRLNDTANRYAVGFYHSNVLPLCYMYLFLFRLVIKKFLSKKETFIWVLIGLCIYYLCKSRTSYLSMFTQCENVGHLENEYDISIIASAHSNRVNFINKIYKKYSSQYKFCVYLYQQPLINDECEWFHDKPLEYKKYIEILRRSRCLLDIQNPIR